MLCRACGHLLSNDNYAVNDSISTLYSCSYCGLWQSFPSESKYDALLTRYKHTNMTEYYSKPLFKEWYTSKYINLFKRLETLSVLPPISKRFYFLDYGCGMGWSMEIARKYFFQNVIGIEMNNSLVNYNNKVGRFCLSVADADWACFRGRDNKINLCIVDNVLEHLIRPAELLNNIYSVLSKNSVLVVAVPGVDIPRKILARISLIRTLVTNPTLNILNDRVEHISFFNRLSMTKLLEDCGFQLIDNSFHHSKYFRGLRLHYFLQTGYYIALKL